ncbi:DEAD/DEAH box helicase [Clostridium oryzae]|uniref:DEAD-box ATP-dependent RNA helicase CshA n=1 Tax=Clostridium oryzae TaxID=1450648 RepID=A0A1V4IIM4_9CLOT|nr:DEAD/DEAH box helicase [Clostridium oryzae]OPJ59858.1 DEAD-box ATP-dependent RNA helicase CshA [Clostridium oryzae]
MDNFFEQLGISANIVQGLIKLGINIPTDIQKEIVPLALENRDVIGQSQTGSGKTLAYLLPLFEKIDISKREMQAIILAPTHELVMQIHRTIVSLSEASNIKVTYASIIGEANINRQIEKLKEKPHIIVGTPGRTLELIKRRKLSAHTVRTIVIDEADRLLDQHNIDVVKAVIKTTLRDRQLLMFSASMSPKSLSAAKELMKEPEVVSIDKKIEISSNIQHYYFTCEQRDKIEILRKLIHAINPYKAIIFINKSEDINITTSKLKYHKLEVEGIHGTNMKEDRKKALEDFRNGKLQLLVASDIASRGLDIKGVTNVFNLDIPEKPVTYLHRVGRCGRAGNEGIAISIVSDREVKYIKQYEKAFKIEISHKAIYKGKIVEAKQHNIGL